MTFDQKLTALKSFIENGVPGYVPHCPVRDSGLDNLAREIVARVLGIDEEARCYRADTALIRDLFIALATEVGAKFRRRGWTVGTTDAGRGVVSNYNALVEAGGCFCPDLNGGYAPALWLRALVEEGLHLSLERAAAEQEAERLAEQRAGFGCLAEWGE